MGFSVGALRGFFCLWHRAVGSVCCMRSDLPMCWSVSNEEECPPWPPISERCPWSNPCSHRLIEAPPIVSRFQARAVFAFLSVDDGDAFCGGHRRRRLPSPQVTPPTDVREARPPYLPLSATPLSWNVSIEVDVRAGLLPQANTGRATPYREPLTPTIICRLSAGCMADDLISPSFSCSSSSSPFYDLPCAF